ncbi:MAG: amino acid adenylation domain-containing protein, partial [Oscillochloris sp.]|nr:amino acid adenylation domain-containing protein [Oscillochloris sp.]
LRGFTTPTPLTVDHATGETGYGRVDYRIPAPMTAQLQTLARQHQLTLNTLVQGAWALVLHRYCGEEDIVFGATVAGRPAELPGVETMVGLFINTLPVRVQIDPQQPLLTWLSRLQAQQFEQRQFEYTPLFELQRWSEVPRDQPLFESLLIFENYPVDASLREQQSALRVSAVQMIEQTNYPLNLAVGPGREVGLTLHYDRARLSADSVERMMGHLATVLAGFAENIQCTLAKVPMLTPAELSQLAAWNDTSVPFLAEHCIHQVIAGWAATQPDHPALRYDGITITYAQLDARANQLAHVLQARGIRPDTLVGLALPRSPDFVIAALATLKAGGAFLPLDLTYPMARLQFMLADSCPAILIAQPDSAAALIPDSLDIPLLDPADPALDLAPVTPPVRTVCPAHLAYVIYTSGSTGKPKGALLSHQGLLNLALWQSRAFDVTPDTRVIQFAALSFDAAVWELVLALANGATLIVATPEQLTPGAPLRALLQRERVSIATLPPSLLAILDPNDLPDLAVVIAAGEASNEHIVQRWAAGRRFINGYGPTETTVCASWHVCDPAASGPPPIGRPITNTRLYVLDSQQHLVPVGVAGELYIGGIGVARGYLNRPELTAERFVQLPALDSGRLYRTGDRVRWQADGTLVFMGRIDHQVKLRGFRIELGEIESALRQYPGIQDAVAIVREDTPGDPRLVAYIVPDAADKPEASSSTRLISALREHLAAQLPHYMIPAAIISLDAWPLTPNGKVDRKALPAPAGSLVFASADFAAPRTPSEDLLAGMW